MKKPYKRILAHLAFWLLYVGDQLLEYGWNNRDYIRLEYSPDMWTDLVMHMLLVYVNLYILVPKFFYPKKYLQYGIALFFCLLAGGLYSRLTGWLIWIPYERTHEYAMYLTEPKNFFVPIRIIRNTLEYCPVVGLTLFLKLIQDAFVRERHMRALKEEKHQAELDLLKAQLHPHFFFNTLNSLYALTMAKSDKGPEVVLQLSELMHYVLYEANAPLVSLETEISHLRNYIEIEQLRFGDRLELRVDTPLFTESQRIAPLLLLPFIENAFKHSLSHEAEKAWIHIDIRLEEDKLCMRVANSCHPPERAGRPPGIGLANVRQRLELSYPGRQLLDIRPGSEVWEVSLTLKLSPDAKDTLRNSR
jgi:two-component system LytT family sensor kinase